MAHHDLGMILLIEDDLEGRELLGSELETAGFTVLSAGNGEEGIRLLRENPQCRAIILDLLMPGMNGWEFRKAQWRHSDLASIPVVVLSSIVSLEQTGALLQAAAWLRKPVDLEQLIEVLKRLVTSRGKEGAHADRPRAHLHASNGGQPASPSERSGFVLRDHPDPGHPDGAR